MTGAGFFLFLAMWFCLPFLPGLIEIRRKIDAKPLKVVQKYDVDIHYFANTFRDYVQKYLANAIEAVNKTSKIQQGILNDGTQYIALSDKHQIPLTDNEREKQTTSALFVSSDSIRSQGAMSYLSELYAKESISGSNEDVYRALLAEDRIDLGESTMLLRWMHAGNTINIPPKCVLHGRVSADKKITIAAGSQFERLHAPQIIFGTTEPAPFKETETTEIKADDLPVIDDSAGRWLVETDLKIPEKSLVKANLVVVGELTIGANSQINGSIKSHDKLILEKNVLVNGSVVSGKDIYIMEGCYVYGPVVSETKICIDRNCCVGKQLAATTISAEEIQVKTNTMSHGTVWARIKGEVVNAND